MIKSTLTAATLALLLAGPAFADDDDGRRGGNDRDRGDSNGYRHDDDRRHDDKWRFDDKGKRKKDWRRDDDRRHDGRDYDRHRYDDRDYGRRGYDDDWRYDGRNDDRYRRHVPPSRYRADYGYRSAYELAWSDWARYGRHDRRWNRSIPKRYRGDQGYRAGYEAGWRDAARNYNSGYRPNSWSRDPRGNWFYGFRIG